MKYYLLASLATCLLIACNKDKEARPPDHRGMGAIGNPHEDFAKYRRKNPHPKKDTVVITPTPGPIASAYTMPSLPYPGQQGSEGSCVAFSIVYAREREYLNQKGYPIQLSPEWLFDNITNDHENCSGSTIISGMEFTRTNGICTWASLPYMWNNGCTIQPTQDMVNEAYQFRISGMQEISTSDVLSMKQVILGNHMMVMQVAVDQAFYDAKAGFIWKTFGGVLGYHSLVVVGYDDNKHAWQVMNSWGTAWGDGGFGWIDYDLYPKVCSNGFVMIL
jgi:C1A family cysteine protease